MQQLRGVPGEAHEGALARSRFGSARAVADQPAGVGEAAGDAVGQDLQPDAVRVFESMKRRLDAVDADPPSLAVTRGDVDIEDEIIVSLPL